MPPPLLDIPPSGALAGIYARSDIACGVHKAPANHVVMDVTAFVANVTSTGGQCSTREGSTRCDSSRPAPTGCGGPHDIPDPEWKYVNVRRLFIYFEHSIDRATQSAVFEPNNERLWGSIRQSVEDFLITVWRDGAHLGTKPEEASSSAETPPR